MSRLFEIEITIRSVVQADCIAQAYQVARNNVNEMADEISLDDVDVEREIKDLAGLPNGWESDSLPWGGDGKQTISEILDAQPPERDTRTIDMFAQVAP